jgi:hypothetical protein
MDLHWITLKADIIRKHPIYMRKQQGMKIPLELFEKELL